MVEVVGQAKGALLHVFETGAAVGTHADVIAAPASGRIEIVALEVHADAASTFLLQTGTTTTALTPVYTLGVNGFISIRGGGAPIAVGIAGESLDVVVGTTGPVNYSIWYRVIP